MSYAYYGYKQRPVKARVKQHSFSYHDLDDLRIKIKERIKNQSFGINDYILLYSYGSYSIETKIHALEEAHKCINKLGITFDNNVNKRMTRLYGDRVIRITSLPYADNIQPEEMSFKTKELNNAFDFKAKKGANASK